MEAALNKLVQPDSGLIQQGTEELKVAMRNPGALEELCQVLGSPAAAPEVRHYAALLLRKKFGNKRKAWSQLPREGRAMIKNGCLGMLVNERNESVLKAVCQLVGAVARHEFALASSENSSSGAGNFGWAELVDIVKHCLNCEAYRVTGMYCLAVLAEAAGNTVRDKLDLFGPYLVAALTQEDQVEVGHEAAKVLANLVPRIGSDQATAFQKLVPPAMQFVRRLALTLPDRASEAMDVFEELFESEVGIVVPHVKAIVDMCLWLAGNSELEDPVRVKAISLLGRITKLKKNTIVKNKLYIPIIDTLFPVLCIRNDADDGDDGDDEDDEGSTPAASAAQTLDVLAVNLPPEKYMSNLLRHVEPALKNGYNDLAKVKGAFYALAVSAEGCSDHIRRKYLASFLRCVGDGIKHETPGVRHAALYALGQFSEFLQPDISDYADSILPVLLVQLDQAVAAMDPEKHNGSLDRIFYALEVFSENLEEKLVPFLPELMNRLIPLATFDNDYKVGVRRLRLLSVSMVGSVANAVKEHLVPYFDHIMPLMMPYLSLDYGTEENQELVTQSLDTLASVAKAVGPTNLVPSLADKCWSLGMQLIRDHDDPDIRKCVYNLFSVAVFVVVKGSGGGGSEGNKDDLVKALPEVVEMMLNSVSSPQGLEVDYGDDDNEDNDKVKGLVNLDTLLDVEDDGSSQQPDSEEDIMDEVDEDEDEEGKDQDQLENIKGLRVENAYLEEKYQALVALRELCKNVGPEAFGPFLPRCYAEVYGMLDYPDEDIREAAMAALASFTVARCKSLQQQADQDKYEEVANFREAVADLVSKIYAMVRTEEDVSVVCASLESLTDLLKGCGRRATDIEGVPGLIVDCMLAIMKSDCVCMDSDGKEHNNGHQVEDDEDEEAEQDEQLFEYAGDVLPSLGKAMADPAAFAPIFRTLLPNLLKKTKRNRTSAEKSFSVGSLAECLESLSGEFLEPFVDQLMPAFLHNFRDEDKEVRNNAIFGIGELALHGGPGMQRHFPAVLQSLSVRLGAETDPRCLDQIVGAVCRLILANKSAVPLAEVVPVVLANLPLKEDLDEYAVVFKCIRLLYSDGDVNVKAGLAKILEISATVYGQKKLASVASSPDVHRPQFGVGGDDDDEDQERLAELRLQLVSLIRQVSADFPKEFAAVAGSLSPELTSNLGAIVQFG